MSAPRRPLRSELNLEKFAHLTLQNLANCYAHLKPGADDNAFINEILNIVGTLDDPAIEEPVAIVMSVVSEEDRTKGPGWVTKSPYGSVVVSCAYCLRALRAMHARNMELAWSYMADARYWCGVAISSKGINEARESTITLTLIKKAKAGAAGRDKTFESIRQHAYKLAKDMRPPEKGWQSRAHAVKTIQGAVVQFTKDEGLKLSKANAEKTIDGWLARMPDAADLFPSRKAKIDNSPAGSDGI
ncbi:hypothetical protein [Cupriavidus basilensis]|uniref:hypothetical protein n=1 Tax=Cupriavidus basilensis TaxID=68895 RepID=UPI00157B6D6D|nr:hypothetical protein [Cupriavidus basilensis]NUA25992.1 hypothetical protein [Cupriavidus basilensis]